MRQVTLFGPPLRNQKSEANLLLRRSGSSARSDRRHSSILPNLSSNTVMIGEP